MTEVSYSEVFELNFDLGGFLVYTYHPYIHNYSLISHEAGMYLLFFQVRFLGKDCAFGGNSLWVAGQTTELCSIFAAKMCKQPQVFTSSSLGVHISPFLTRMRPISLPHTASWKPIGN